MGLCFVSRTLGLQRVDGCRSQLVQARKKSKNGGRVEVTGEGIERWGIEGIRIGTSDRFGWGRGEYVKRQLLLLTFIFLHEGVSICFYSTIVQNNSTYIIQQSPTAYYL